MSHVSKITAERNQKALLDLAMLPGNDVCADCKAKTPRWASYNLGIFICMTCASIHRKIGTHVTKVKSLTMDSWTKEQVEHMKEMGNIKSNAIYNPNELRHPPPPNMIDSERDSDLEKYIRSKYEYKSFFDRSALVASKLGPSRSVSNRLSTFSAAHSETKAPESLSSQPSARPSSIAVTNPASSSSTTQSIPHVQQSAAAPSNPAVVTARAPFRSVSQPGPAQPSVQPPISQPQVPSNNPTWNDLISLQTPFSNASLPLQYTSGSFNSPSASTSLPVSMQSSALTQPNGTNPYSNLAANPASALPSSFTQMAGISPGGFGRSMSLNSGLSAQAPMPTGLGFGPNLNGGIGASSLQQSNMPFNSTPMMTPTNAKHGRDGSKSGIWRNERDVFATSTTAKFHITTIPTTTNVSVANVGDATTPNVPAASGAIPSTDEYEPVYAPNTDASAADTLLFTAIRQHSFTDDGYSRIAADATNAATTTVSASIRWRKPVYELGAGAESEWVQWSAAAAVGWYVSAFLSWDSGLVE
ncbi:unnamed protein product [Somion occarium]|uniref:Arf-GAP domain-containing protein n=1 Tax=Somion occarium TaxID=3059160 RepID=A0ABP1DP80_9APHY